MSPAPSHAASLRDRIRRHPVAAWIGAILLLLLVVAAVALQGAFLRAPLERFLTEKTGHPVTIGALEAGIQHGFTVRLRDVSVQASGDGETEPLRAQLIVMRVRPLALLRRQLVLRELAVEDARLHIARDAQGRWNLVPLARTGFDKDPTSKRKAWKTEAPTEGAPRPPALPFTIEQLSLKQVKVELRDAVRDVQGDIDVATIASADQPYRTRLEFSGKYEGDAFSGVGLTGEALSLQDTDVVVPLDLQLKAGPTELMIQGQVGDVLVQPRIDARVRIAGPSLRTLYPTLPVALPSTPAYRLSGQLQARKGEYKLSEIDGRIGRSDIRGEASFDARGKRPLLDARLRSRRLALGDLGVLVGVGERPRGPSVLPDARFDSSRLNAMDAIVEYSAQQMVMPDALPLEDFSSKLVLRNGRLQLDPLKFGFSGGDIVANIVLDGRREPMASEMAVDFRNIQFNQMFPTLDRGRLSAGRLGAQLRLKGTGQSVASFLGSSSGSLAAAMSGGRVSHAVMAAASLDGGKLLPLLVKGDEPINVRCAAVSMVVDKGIARSQLLVFDTESVRVDGSGAIDLTSERFDLELKAKPKRPSLLSLRAPVYVEGTFRDAKIAVSPGTLLRGGAAAALTVLNPLAALLPLIEPGEGEDADCRQSLKPVLGALDQASESPSKTPPVKAPPVKAPPVKAGSGLR
jgi:uncharacterized protein involved in outer membrane biogenesis